MNREMPQPRKNGSELPPGIRPPSEVSSGPLRSPLNKVLQKETKIPEGKEWVKGLIDEIPVAYLPIVTDFLRRVPPNKAEEAARKLFDVITEMTNGVLRSPNPKETLQECIREAEKRIGN